MNGGLPPTHGFGQTGMVASDQIAKLLRNSTTRETLFLLGCYCMASMCVCEQFAPTVNFVARLVLGAIIAFAGGWAGSWSAAHGPITSLKRDLLLIPEGNTIWLAAVMRLFKWTQWKTVWLGFAAGYVWSCLRSLSGPFYALDGGDSSWALFVRAPMVNSVIAVTVGLAGMLGQACSFRLSFAETHSATMEVMVKGLVLALFSVASGSTLLFMVLPITSKAMLLKFWDQPSLGLAYLTGMTYAFCPLIIAYVAVRGLWIKSLMQN